MLNDYAEGKRDSIQCVGYGRADGMPSVECPGTCQPAGTTTPDGRLWIPTVTGLVSVSPNEIVENKLPPPVWIEEVGIDGKSTVISHATTVVKVPPGRRRFEFRFTALSFSSPEKIRFRHKLEGLDADWSPADALRTAAYSYVPPGSYEFKVTACNNDGIWNTSGQSIQLVVQPFVWQTWWFKAGMGLLLLVTVALVVRRAERWRARLRIERLEQQHAVERERSRISKDIHDDLGANLTQIVFLSQRAEGAAHESGELERWLQMIPATARRTIRSLDEIVWAINPKHDSLESLANYLAQFAPEHLSLAGIRCVLDVPMVLPHLSLSAEVRHNLILVVREALQNVVTHAGATEVRVSLRLDEAGLEIAIADNGRGFDVERVHGDGNGLPNMRRRLADIGGRLEIASQAGQGTTVRLSLERSRLHGRVIGQAGGPG
jgi:signal transduction histidine kinase